MRGRAGELVRGLTRGRRRMDLDGRTALVTGAARGIGLETARRLHERGAQVALIDLDPAAAEQAAGELLRSYPSGSTGPRGGEGSRDSEAPGAIGIGADVADSAAIEGAVAAAAESLGPIDVVVANAGIAPHAATGRAMEPEAFERVIEVNLLGAWRTVRAALPQVAARQGHLVLVSSIYAFMNGAFVSPYACSKAAVEQLGRALRVELAQHRATCSVAYFGFVDTEMVRQGFEADDLGARLEASVPRRLRPRIGPADAATAIVEGIEARRPRIVEPRAWRPLALARGIAGPLMDRHMARDARIQALAAEADRPGRRPGQELTAGAPRPPGRSM